MKTERDHSSVYLTVSSCEPRPALAVDGGILENALAILVAQIALSCGGCKKQTNNELKLFGHDIIEFSKGFR